MRAIWKTKTTADYGDHRHTTRRHRVEGNKARDVYVCSSGYIDRRRNIWRIHSKKIDMMKGNAQPPQQDQQAKPEPGHLVVVGSINADFVLNVDRLPMPGETVSSNSMELFPGGKGANQAAAAGRLGYPTHLIGQVGANDANIAEFLTSALAESRVVTDRIKTVADCNCGSAYIFLQPTGENSIVILGGANQHHWELSDADKTLLSEAGAVLLQREIPESVNIQVAKWAQASGVPVLLDAGGVDDPLDDELLSNVTILSPNESELARLTNMPTSTEAETVEAAKSLFRNFDVKHVLVKLGARGSMMLSKGSDDILRQDALPVPKVVDTTGAGDCFTAAFSLGYVQSWPMQKCLLFASAAASLCIQEKGAMSSLPFLRHLDSKYYE